MSQPAAADPILNPVSTHGLTRLDSGLLVPESAVPPQPPPTLTREVWLREDLKILRRMDKRLVALGVRTMLLCVNPDCKAPLLGLQAEEDGTTVLQCGCKRREIR